MEQTSGAVLASPGTQLAAGDASTGWRRRTDNGQEKWPRNSQDVFHSLGQWYSKTQFLCMN